jgi:hypothetical protein
MPSITYATKEEIPEGLRDFAKENTEEAGGFIVKVVAEAKLDEFREKNISLSQQIETMGPVLARIKAIAGDDFDAFETDVNGLRDIKRRVDDGELKTNDQIEQAVADRIKAVKDGYEQNEKAERQKRVDAENKALTLQQRLDQTEIRHGITSVVIHPESGVRTEALPDILERAYRLFKMVDGKPVPMNGEATIYGANGADPMSYVEWIVKLRDEAPHFFKGNAGGGADGNSSKKSGGFTQAEIDKMSPQQKLAIANGTLRKK